MRAGKGEFRLMSGGEVGRARDGLQTHKDKQPEQHVKDEGREHEDANIDASLNSPECQRSANVTREHQSVLSATTSLTCRLRRAMNGRALNRVALETGC